MRWEIFALLAAIGVLVGTASVSAASIMPSQPDALDQHPDMPDVSNQPGHPYHTWETLTVDLHQLVQENPDIARLHPGGESVMGLELWVVEIADFDDQDRKPLDEREVLWLDGGTHANEQLGMELAYDWAEFLIEAYGDNETATWIVENRHTFVMPLVNPDGNHQDSRWNANTVNINRNYPTGWMATEEDPVFNDPGPYPASEPETQAVVDWFDALEPDYVNSFHTGTELMLYPWGYFEHRPPDDQVFQRICEEIGEDDPEFCGPVYDTIYPASGNAIDTAYERVGSVAWTYEVSEESSMHASVEDPRERLQRYWDGVEHAFLNVEKYGAHPVLDEVTREGENVVLTITNEGYGNLTEGELTLQLSGGEDVNLDLGSLGDGESKTLRASLSAGEAEDGRIVASFTYPERVQASPIEERSVPTSLAIVDGGLAEVRLDEPVEQASIEDGEDNPVPGPAPVALVVAVLASAVLPRRWA